jgi:hypothetical protein
MGTCRSFTIDFSVQVPWIHHWYVYSCLKWLQNIRDCQRKMQSEKSRTPDFVSSLIFTHILSFLQGLWQQV